MLSKKKFLIDFVAAYRIHYSNQALTTQMRTYLRTVVGLTRNPCWREIASLHAQMDPGSSPG